MNDTRQNLSLNLEEIQFLRVTLLGTSNNPLREDIRRKLFWMEKSLLDFEKRKNERKEKHPSRAELRGANPTL